MKLSVLWRPGGGGPATLARMTDRPSAARRRRSFALIYLYCSVADANAAAGLVQQIATICASHDANAAFLCRRRPRYDASWARRDGVFQRNHMLHSYFWEETSYRSVYEHTFALVGVSFQQ